MSRCPTRAATALMLAPPAMSAVIWLLRMPCGVRRLTPAWLTRRSKARRTWDGIDRAAGAVAKIRSLSIQSERCASRLLPVAMLLECGQHALGQADRPPPRRRLGPLLEDGRPLQEPDRAAPDREGSPLDIHIGPSRARAVRTCALRSRPRVPSTGCMLSVGATAKNLRGLDRGPDLRLLVGQLRHRRHVARDSRQSSPTAWPACSADESR